MRQGTIPAQTLELALFFGGQFEGCVGASGAHNAAYFRNLYLFDLWDTALGLPILPRMSARKARMPVRHAIT
jgi:hypothetical protein